MKRQVMKIMGTTVAVAVVLLAGVRLYLSICEEAVEARPPAGEQQLAERGEDAVPGTEEGTEAGEDVRAPAGDPPQSSTGDLSQPGNWLEARDWEEFADGAARDLRTQFGRTIADKGTQVSLMELREFLRQKYPEDWETKLDDLLHRAFPDLADQVLDSFAKMDLYDEWFEENKPDLAAMKGEEIEDALWQRRREIFGEDATEIWTPRSATERIRDTLDILEEAYDVPLDDELELFASAVDRLYQDEAGALVRDNTHSMVSAFLNLDSVQDELLDMSPEERAESLRRIRSSLGIDEQQIAAMEVLDAERERRWQRGLRYMAERADLTQDYEGARLEEELRLLRERAFEEEAATIAAEEASGFFRYDRRRVYGRN